MIRSLLLVPLLFAGAGQLVGQSVVITPKEVTYTRKGKDVREPKRTFTVRYPVVGGKISRQAKTEIENNLDYWRNFETTLEENLVEGDWLSSLDYAVNYNKHNILDITLTMEGVGAYPDGSSKYFVLDTRSGKRVTFEDVFIDSELTQLLEKIRAEMRRKEAALDQEHKDDLASRRQSYAEFYPSPDRLQLTDLAGFSVSDKGITFLYEYNYPHVAKFYEPDGRFFLPYSVLKPHIRPAGLLERLVR